jgi:hypothetical protein
MAESNETRLDIAKAKESITKAQKAGRWPSRPESPQEAAPSLPHVPPFVTETPHQRSHEEAMATYHKILSEYEQLNQKEKAQIAAHQLQTENTPAPQKEVKKNFFKKIADWFSRVS